MGMGIIQHWLYLRDLSKYPAVVPYEELSSFYAFKLQKQGYYLDLTVKKLFKNFTHSIYVKAWMKIMNMLPKKIAYVEHTYWIHHSPGMYAHYPEKCKPNCKYCKKQTIMVHRWRM